jgi:hypothetical protein
LGTFLWELFFGNFSLGTFLWELVQKMAEEAQSFWATPFPWKELLNI